jgi:hypothetical protein
MPKYDRYITVARVIVLVLFIVSLFGTWAFDKLNVPAEYACSKPTIRLDGDFCGYPMSGFQSFSWLASGFFNILFAVMTGAFNGRFLELQSGLLILLLVPILTTSLLIWKKGSRRIQTINLVAWILACVPVIMFILSMKDHLLIQLWGFWLYVVLAISALTVEILNRKSDGQRSDAA